MNIFNQAIESHAEWKMRLKRHIDLGRVVNLQEAANCHACDLGQWIYGEGLRFNSLPSFESLCASHELFHRAAAEVVVHSNAGDKDKALSLLRPNGVFSEKSNNLVQALMSCSRELAQHVVKYTHHNGKVIDILNNKAETKIHSVQETLSVLDALKYMVEHNIGSLVVMKGDDFVGIFTERGFAQNIVVKGAAFLDSPISEIVDADMIHINAYDSIEQAMTLMTSTHKRHLPVMENGQLIGVISIGDVVKKVVSDDLETLTQLEDYMHGSYGAHR